MDERSHCGFCGGYHLRRPIEDCCADLRARLKRAEEGIEAEHDARREAENLQHAFDMSEPGYNEARTELARVTAERDRVIIDRARERTAYSALTSELVTARACLRDLVAAVRAYFERDARSSMDTLRRQLGNSIRAAEEEGKSG